MNVEQEVWNEVEMIRLLDVTKEQIDRLRREEGLPYVRLNNKKRVYLAEEFVPWLQKRGVK